MKKLETLTKEERNNKEFFLKAAINCGFALDYASERLRDDRKIVLAAVINCGDALQYASERLRKKF